MGMELLEKLGADFAQPMMVRACLDKAGLIFLFNPTSRTYPHGPPHKDKGKVRLGH